MNINLTLFGESLAFAAFVWFCMKYIWPYVLQALDERRARIAEGLAAAEEGVKAREHAEVHAQQALQAAREQAKDIIANAQKRADQIVEDAKSGARVEGDKIIEQSRGEVDQQMNEARETLRREVVTLALRGAEQVLMQEVDATAHAAALDKLAAQL